MAIPTSATKNATTRPINTRFNQTFIHASETGESPDAHTRKQPTILTHARAMKHKEGQKYNCRPLNCRNDIKQCISGGTLPADISKAPNRSEEHTSELQSRENLVCRLLLEQKNALQ